MDSSGNITHPMGAHGNMSDATSVCLSCETNVYNTQKHATFARLTDTHLHSSSDISSVPGGSKILNTFFNITLPEVGFSVKSFESADVLQPMWSHPDVKVFNLRYSPEEGLDAWTSALEDDVNCLDVLD
eukprot:1180952-Prorocentrum_minimum.AAC.7